MAYRRSLDFLPNVFRTEVNDKFLHATIDQLISEPELKRIDGYVGRKFSPVAGPNDSFINEFSTLRQNYQLEPHTTFIDEKSKIQFTAGYVDLLRRIDTLGGFTNDHSRLFDDTSYNFDAFINYDKFLNYSNYYWLPNGPDSVPVFATAIPLQQEFNVIPPLMYQIINGSYDKEDFDVKSFDVSDNSIKRVKEDGIKFDVTGNKINPTIRLARGGTYTFNVNQTGHGFYIQTQLGTTENLAWQNNLSSRDVYGVENNGEDVGVITFKVPNIDSQKFFSEMPEFTNANLIAFASNRNRALRYSELHYKQYSDIIAKFGGVDGQRMLEGKTIVFLKDPASGKNPQPWQKLTDYAEGDLIQYGNTVYRVLENFTSGNTFNANNLELYDLQESWYNPDLFDSIDRPFDSDKFDVGEAIEFEQRRGLFNITINSEGFIVLRPSTIIPRNQKVTILEGISYGNKKVYRNSNDDIELVPVITATLDRLYYTDSLDNNISGIIEIVDQDNNLKIDVVGSILGKKRYQSPNGVSFTNGLKIKFLDDVAQPEYANKSYYIEGVGSSIELIDTDALLSNETWLDVIEIPYDMELFDSEKFAASTNSPLAPDYILINRSSMEQSAWARHNRWFHKDVIELTARYNNYPSIIDSTLRAKRPIIEFDPHLQLFNFGKVAKKAVDVIDNTTVDALSIVEGQPVVISDENLINFSGSISSVEEFKAEKEREGYTVVKQITSDDGIVTIQMKLGGVSGFYVDDIPLYPGMRVIFTADKDPDVRNKIYEVQWIRPQSSANNRSWSFVADGSTSSYDLNFEVLEPSQLMVLVNGISASAQQYFWSYQEETQSVVFSSTLPPAEANISISLKFDDQIHLVLADDGNVQENECVYIKQGIKNQGVEYHFINGSWKKSQQKTSINQPPKFDLFDSNQRSFSDTAIYPSSNFTGNQLFGYDVGNTVVDPVLGIKLKYRNINNIGDIVFADFITKGSFTYREGQRSIAVPTTGGKVKVNKRNTDQSEFRNQWKKIKQKSRQLQLQTFYATDYQKNLFKLNVTPDVAGEGMFSNIIVYVNNKFVYTNHYDLQIEDENVYLMFQEDLTVGDKLDIKIKSTQSNEFSVFEPPLNYTNNPFNKEVSEITLGQMRNHILNCVEDIPELSDEALTENNLRDTLDVKSYRGTILQHNGSSHLANYFLNNTEGNFTNAVINAQREYVRFKNRLLQLTNDLAVVGETASQTLERVMSEIVANKNKNFAYFTSDMLPFGYDFNRRIYKVVDNRLDTYDLSEILDLTKANSKAVLVYLNNKQLLVNRDYTFSTDRPVITLNFDSISINKDDIIEVREYVTTDGSYIPATPTKLGLYPLYIPSIVVDGYGDATRQMIRGHDGSLTTVFGDVRDDVLLEYETRVYNNIKVKYNQDRFDIWDYIPGAFRATSYNVNEFNSILSSHFSSWSGSNAIAVSDYRNFEAGNAFTYNYGRFTNKVDGGLMPASHWRGIYKHYFDTDAPDTRPWEMLGFAEKPDYWDQSYGPAPYTSGNTVLWDDIEAGRILFGERAGIDARFARPGLKNILPVNVNGELLSPFDCIVKDINELDVSGFYKFGDGGPVETVWRQSSEYPFVVQLAISIMKPAEYFGVNIDTNNQVLNLQDSQLIFGNTGIRDISTQLVQTELDSNNNACRVHSYLNWICDYCKQNGLSVEKYVGQVLRNLESRLGYKVAGYTDKKYLKIITDQYTPASNNPGVIIPDDDFEIVLNKSSPLLNLTYSGVIITKTVDGYSVSGYDDNKPYFTIESSVQNSNASYIKVGKLAITKYHDGSGEFYRVPYGTEFFSIDQVGDFLISYGRYLTRQGFQFIDKVDEDASWYQDWDLSVREFLFYVQQGWDVDVAISLSPVGSKINYRSLFGVVDGLSNRPLSTRILDEDFKIVRASEYTVYRNGRDFNAKVDNQRGIYLLDIDVVEYEHILLLNNKTRFNDIIYDPLLGDRQHRLRLQGFKTNDWDGSYSAAGFIINEDNVEEWKSGVNYNKGDIVFFKEDYFTAADKVAASNVFELEKWIKTDYSTIKKGLLPNLANRAGLFKQFYNPNEVNLEQDAQKLGKNLIGFESRSYMEDLGISDTSQFKFYQGMLSQKGTNSSLDKLLKAKVDNFGGKVNSYEEWAIRLGSYGSTDNTRNLQIELDETWAFKDPLVIELLDSNDEMPTGHKGLKSKDIYVKHVPFNKHFLRNRAIADQNTDLYTAGYLQLSDVDYISPTRSSLNSYVQGTGVGSGDLIWVASDRNNQWGVYRITDTDIRLESLSVIQSGDAKIKCVNNHNLVKNDLVYIISDNTNPKAFGFYTVTNVIDARTFVVSTGYGTIQINPFSGFVYKLNSVRFDSAQDIVNSEPLKGWQAGDKLFIDNANDDGWAIYENQKSWEVGPTYSSQFTNDGDRLGQSVASDIENYYMIAGRPGSELGRGSVVIYSVTSTGSLEEIANLTSDSTGVNGLGFSVTASNEATFVAGAPESDSTGFATVFAPDVETGNFITKQIIAPETLDENGEFGYSVKLSNDGNWLVVGQPGVDEGFVHVYQRKNVSILPSGSTVFIGDGSSTVFALTGDLANPNDVSSVSVLQDNIALVGNDDFTISGNNLIFAAAPAFGSKLNVTVNRGSPKQKIIADGSSASYALTGDNATPSSIYALFVEVNGIIQVPFRDYNLSLVGNQYIITFTDTPAIDLEIDIVQRTHYELVSSFTSPTSEVGDRFGHKVEFSQQARQIIVSAPNATVNGVAEAGKVYYFDRSAEIFVSDGEETVYETNVPIEGNPVVYIDNNLLVQNQSFTRLVNEITLASPAPTGSLVKVETNNFFLISEITAESANDAAEENAHFGASIVICPTNCSIYIGSPQRDTTKINAGKVYRFVNQSRYFGTILATVQNPVISTNSAIALNDFLVYLPENSTIDDIVDAINNAIVPNVTAYNKDGYLYLETNRQMVGEKITIAAVLGQPLEDIGLEVLVHQQTITSPVDDHYVEFGQTLAIGPSADILAIGSARASTRVETTIDNKTTYFDSRATSFNDIKKESGAAWVYQYIPTANSTVDNPGQFIPAQRLVNPLIDNKDEYGISLSVNKKSIFVGAPSDDTYDNNAGVIMSFSNPNSKAVWVKVREKGPKVDISLINRAFLYNIETNKIITDLDFIDPVKGKISGLAEQEIAYKTPYDPAVYSTAPKGKIWGKEHVGQVWWDISQTRWLNYEQGSIDSRGLNWNTAFPGSSILCYEWIESNLPPTQFVDEKDTTAFARSNTFNLLEDIDPNTGVITNKYYYWVAGKRTIPTAQHRKYSTVAIENLIANPRSAGIPFMAFLSSNAIALYNCSQFLQDKNIVLSIDYDVTYNENSIHTEFQLLAENNEKSLPNTALVQKLIDSLAGSNTLGDLVPDIKLTVGERYGIEYRPRQTMFRDRKNALKAAVSYINKVLASIPARDSKNVDRLLAFEPIPNISNNFYDDTVNDNVELSYLNIALYPEGYKVLVRVDNEVSNNWTIYKKVNNAWVLEKVQAYDNRRYITLIDWVKPGVSDPVVTDYTINFSYEISSITPNVGDTVKIRNYGDNRYAILQFTEDQTYELIKQEASSYKIIDALWEEATFAQGFDRETFDVQIFDDWATVEIQNILTAVYYDIFNSTEEIEKNRWFLLMMQHLLAEQKYVDWIFKTSFIKVEHRNQQAISQIPSLQKDRQDSLRKYIEEIKPYHTKIREFVTSHEGKDTANAGVTDFDVPAYYDETSGKYRSPTGLDEIDDIIFERPEYSAYLNNYTLEVDSVFVHNPGENYSAPPKLTLVSSTGSGTTLESTVVNGEVTKVTVKSGTGYLTTPTLEIDNGSGAGAVLVPIMTNKKVRSIKDVIKFDRVPNNGGFLVQFMDIDGNTVDIRTQRKSRLQSEAGLVDVLLDALSGFNWIKEINTEIGWPVDNASNYRIFADTSGRIQVQYKKTPGGWTAEGLQDYLRSLGQSVGVDGLDISGTTVIEDGNMSLYAPTVLNWEPNTRYDRGDIIVYNNRAYTLRDEVPSTVTSDIFDTVDFRDYSASEFESHLNRTWAYYQPVAGLPGKDLGQLFAGIEYPGVKVIGPSFRDEPGFDVGNYDMSVFDQFVIGPEGVKVLDESILDQTIYSNFLDTTLGTKPEDIITSGGQFVDTYVSHSPEEAVPGRVYDTLDIRVYSVPANDVDSKGLGLSILTTVLDVNESSVYKFVPTTTKGDSLIVFTKNFGRLDPATDYTVDYKNKTVTITKQLLENDIIFINAFNGGGEGLSYDQEIICKSTVKEYILQIEYEQIDQSYVSLNGQQIQDYSLNEFEKGLTVITLGNSITVAEDDVLHLHLFTTDSTVPAFVNLNIEKFVISGTTYPNDYIIELENEIGYSYPSAEKIIVELNNNRLRPPNQAYYVGDGSTVEFSVPTTRDLDLNAINDATVQVAINGIKKQSGTEWELLADGSSIPTVLFYGDAPTEFDNITISVLNNAEYTLVGSNKILISQSVTLVTNDEIRVTTFTNDEKLGIKTTLYQGLTSESVTTDIGFDDVPYNSVGFDSQSTNILNTSIYELPTPVKNINYLWVTVDQNSSNGGRYLFPNSDYELIDNGTKIKLLDSITIFDETVLVVTQFGENQQAPAISFRMFKDLNDNFNYYRVGGTATTTLKKTLLITDTEIFVNDASVLSEPNIDLAIPGVIMVGGERIIYFGRDLVSNKLTNIRRGVDGTGAISVLPINTVIQDASFLQKLSNAHDKIWYDLGENDPTNGLGLQYSTTPQAKFLLQDPALPVSVVFDGKYFVPGYIENGYVLGNLY